MTAAVSEMVSLLQSHDPLQFVQALFLSNNLVEPESYSEPEHKGQEARVEYAQSLAMAIDCPGQGEAPATSIQRFIDLIDQVLDQMPWYFTLRIEKERPLAESAFMMLTRFLFMRGSSFQTHEQELICRIFEPHDPWLKERYGLTTQAVLSAIDMIGEQCQQHVDTTLIEGGRRLAELHAEYRVAQEPDVFMRQAEVQARLADALGLAFKRSHLPTKVDPAGGCLATLLPLISAKPGDNRNFLTFAKSPGWPTNDTIISSRPLVLRDEEYFCPNFVLLYRQRFEILMGLIRQDPHYYRKTFCHRRAGIVEAIALDHFRKLLPGAGLYSNLFFRPNGPGTEPRLECDGLITFDGYLFIVESKAGELSLSARRGSLDRLESELGELVRKAHEQGLAVKAYIEKAASASFEDQDGHSVVTLPNASGFRGIFLVTTTLADLSGIATHLNVLGPSGLVKGRDWPWCVFLNDLRVISELIESPAELVLYLERRLKLNDHGIFAAGDELDYLGFFFEEGLHFEDDVGEDLNRFTMVGYTIGIERYYDFLAGKVSSGEKPRLKISAAYRSIVQAVERTPIPGRTYVAKTLLSFSGETHDEILKALQSATAKVVADRQAHSYTLLNRDIGPLVLVCFPRGSVGEVERIRSYAAAKCVQVKAKTAICIEFEVDMLLGERTLVGFEIVNSPEKPGTQVVAAAENLRRRALARYRLENGEPGRNDDCPCGSGSKYKKCCWRA